MVGRGGKTHPRLPSAALQGPLCALSFLFFSSCLPSKQRPPLYKVRLTKRERGVRVEAVCLSTLAPTPGTPTTPSPTSRLVPSRPPRVHRGFSVCAVFAALAVVQ